MQKLFKELFKQFVAKNGVEPKGIDLIRLKYKAAELNRQANKIKIVDFEKTPITIKRGQEATVNTLKTKSDDVAPGTLQADVENLKVDAEDIMNDAIRNKNQAMTDLDDFIETGGQPFKKKDNKFLGGSMHEEGQIRTGIRMFLQDEVKNGRLKLNKEDLARVMEYFPTIADDPILVFKKIYGDDAYNAAGKFPGAFENGADYNAYREIFKKNMDESYLKIKKTENLGDGTLTLTDEVRAPIKDEDVPFAGGGVVKRIIKSLTMKNKDPMDSMKELNEVLKRRKELDLTDNQVDEIMDAGNDWIFQRDPDNLFMPDKTTPKSFFDDTVEEVDLSQGMIDLDELNFTKNAQAAKEAIDSTSDADLLMRKYPGMNIKLATQIANDTNPKRKADVIAMVEQTMEMGSKGMSGDEIIEIFKKTPRTKQADGGQTTSTGLNYLLGEDDTNSRVPYASGGRRGFLKLLASLGAAGVAFKSGLTTLKFGKPAAKPVAKAVAEAATGQPPAYFLNLVAKIKTLGDDAPRLATADRQTVKTYKDYTLTEDVTTGKQEVVRMKVLDDDSASYYGQPLTEETYMSHTPGEIIIGKNKKPVKIPDEYEEGTATLRSDRGNAGEIVDESFEISDEVIEEGTKFEDNLSDFGKADGGRIDRSGGGIMKIIKKLVKPKKKKLETVKDFVDKRKFLKSMVGETEKNKKARELKMLKEAMEEARENPGFKFKDIDVDKEIKPIFDQSKDRTLNAGGGIITKLIKKLNTIDPGSTKRGKLSKPMSKKAKDKKELREAIENFSKRNRAR